MSDPVEASPERCPECGAVLDRHAPQGLCVRCLGRTGLLPGRGGEAAGPVGGRLPRAGSFADYELEQEIGHGGMGIVYRARQLSLNRLVALKVLLGGQFANAQARGRFRDEAEIAAQLRHPNIVAIHDVGEHDNLPFFTMDYVPGRSLADLAERQPLPSRTAATYLKTVAEAIQYAHQRGVLHRDLKPSNILIDDADQPRVTDFGLAKRMTGSSSDLTVSGQALGSPSFISPEQAEGRKERIGPGTDVYGLGAILYYLLTTRPPFVADNPALTLRQVQEDEPVAPRLLNPGVPRDLETICLKCLRKEVGHRYGSAGEVAEELGRFLRGEPIRARPLGWVGRSWRWCRRKPGMAVSLALVMALLALSSTVAVRLILAQRGQEEERYRAQIQSAERYLQEGHVDLAMQALLQSPGRLRHWEWGYLVAQCHREVVCLEDAVDQGLVKKETYLELKRPWSCRFSADGRRVAALNPSGVVCIWELASGKVVYHQRHAAQPHVGIHLTSDWSDVVFAAGDGVRMAATAGGAEARLLPGSAERIQRLAVSPRGDFIAAVSEEERLQLWDAKAEGPPRVYPAIRAVGWLQFSSDGRRLLAASKDQVAVYDPVDGRRLSLSDHAEAGVTDLMPSPEGDRYLTIDLEDRIRLWTLDGRSVPLRREPGRIFFEYLRFSPDGRRFFFPGEAGSAAVRDANTGEALFHLAEHASRGWWSPDGTQLATSGFGNFARLWDLGEERAWTVLRGHRALLHDLTFSSDGRLIASISMEGALKIWSARRGREFLPGDDGCVQGLDRTTDDRLLVVSDAGSKWTRVWEADGGVLRAEMRRATRAMSRNAVSPDNHWVAVGCTGGETALWDLKTGRLERVLRGHGNPVYDVAFSPDGRYLVTASGDRTAKIWAVGSWTVRHTLPGHVGEPWSVAVSPDSRWVATASRDGIARIWDLETGECRHVLRGHGDWITAVAFTPDSRTVVTASRDRLVHFWDVRNGALMRTWETRGAGWRVAFSGDGRRALIRLSPSDQGAEDPVSTEIWDVATGRQLMAFRGHDEMGTTGYFTSDDRRLVVDHRFADIHQMESFPWREAEYPVVPGATLEQRMRLYADGYWRDRLAAEGRGLTPAPPVRTVVPFDRTTIPARDPQAPSALLDLTAYYTSTLKEGSYTFYGGHVPDLRKFPCGRVEFHGVSFDARGIVQLQLLEPQAPRLQMFWNDLPEGVSGIRVGGRFLRLHALLGTGSSSVGGAPSGRAVGVFRLRYADGGARDLPIVYGHHVRSWLKLEDPATELVAGRLAWEGQDPLDTYPDARLRVFQSVWENPRPGEEVASIDFLSLRTFSAPFLIALTIE